METDVIVVGHGLAGLTAAAEVADAGRRVVLLDQEPEQSLGGQAFWSLGGLFLVDTPEQRRMGVHDSHDLALSDWMGSAQFDREEDLWPRRWAEAYVDFAAGEKRSWLRGMGNIGIIALSTGNEARNRIVCFERGADLHFTKPVDGEELVHGLRNLLRRLAHNGIERAASVTPPSDWFFDTTHWRLQAPNGPSVKLSAVEAKFVRRLLVQTGAVVSRAELRTELGYGDDAVGDKNLDAVIRRLRRKIESATGSPAPIQTVHGQGYLFSAPLRLERRRALER